MSCLGPDQKISGCCTLYSLFKRQPFKHKRDQRREAADKLISQSQTIRLHTLSLKQSDEVRTKDILHEVSEQSSKQIRSQAQHCQQAWLELQADVELTSFILRLKLQPHRNNHKKLSGCYLHAINQPGETSFSTKDMSSLISPHLSILGSNAPKIPPRPPVIICHPWYDPCLQLPTRHPDDMQQDTTGASRTL